MIINDEYRRDGHSSAQAQRHFGPGGTGMSRASARAPNRQLRDTVDDSAFELHYLVSELADELWGLGRDC